MTVGQNSEHDGTRRESMFSCCEEMMKIMGRRADSRGDRKDFERFCASMSAMCGEMMKKMEATPKEKGE